MLNEITWGINNQFDSLYNIGSLSISKENIPLIFESTTSFDNFINQTNHIFDSYTEYSEQSENLSYETFIDTIDSCFDEVDTLNNNYLIFESTNKTQFQKNIFTKYKNLSLEEKLMIINTIITILSTILTAILNICSNSPISISVPINININKPSDEKTNNED